MTKCDGFRACRGCPEARRALYSRNGNNISEKYPTISAALAKTRHEAVIDGELVVGRTAHRCYCACDLMYFDSTHLGGKTLLERKDCSSGPSRGATFRLPNAMAT